MCLYIGNKKSFVAKKDIVVYKYVRKQNSYYVTACRNFPIQTNKVLTPSYSSEDIVETNYHKYTIFGGAIHACTSSNDDEFRGYVCLKAYIKEGTEFWVQDDFKEVAARSLYITDEVVENKETSDIKDIYVSILESVEEHKNGIKVGDFLLADKTYASPLNEFDHSKAIAVVIGFNPEDDSPIHVTPEKMYLPFITRNNYHNSCHSDVKHDKIEDDFDGYKHTYDIANAEDYNANLFKAIDYCINYSTEGTNKGDWHLGAGGEIIMLAKNLAIVNASILLTNIGTPITTNSWSWTSSQYREFSSLNVCSWVISLHNCLTSYYWNYRGGEGLVCPLLVLNNKRKRSYIKLLFNKLLKLFKENSN